MGLTGISICKDCSALQVLEGDEQVVMDLFKLISDDPRVINPLILIKRMSARREFLNWSTVYENAGTSAASFELKTKSLSKVMPDDLSPEINTIYQTFARVTGMT